VPLIGDTIFVYRRRSFATSRARDQAFGDAPLGAVQADAREIERSVRLRDVGISAGEVAGVIGRIQNEERLPLRDRHAFLDEDGFDLSGDFRLDVDLLAGHDAARFEDVDVERSTCGGDDQRGIERCGLRATLLGKPGDRSDDRQRKRAPHPASTTKPAAHDATSKLAAPPWSLTILPSAKVITRSACSATAASCVTMTIVIPCA